MHQSPDVSYTAPVLTTYYQADFDQTCQVQRSTCSKLGAAMSPIMGHAVKWTDDSVSVDVGNSFEYGLGALRRARDETEPVMQLNRSTRFLNIRQR